MSAHAEEQHNDDYREREVRCCSVCATRERMDNICSRCATELALVVSDGDVVDTGVTPPRPVRR